MRNRIISGLCPATAVMEAGNQSGSLITAKRAFEQNRLVFALPGRVDSEQSKGCNGLLKKEAKFLESLDDIADALTLLPGFKRELKFGKPEDLTLIFPELSIKEKKICQCLSAGELGFDELVNQTGEPVNELLYLLFEMELKRLVRQLPGKKFRILN
jgi:DNA processing protein